MVGARISIFLNNIPVKGFAPASHNIDDMADSVLMVELSFDDELGKAIRLFNLTAPEPTVLVIWQDLGGSFYPGVISIFNPFEFYVWQLSYLYY